MKKIIFFTFFLIIACSTESKTESYNKSDCKDARLVDSLDYDSTQYLFDCGLNDKVINIIKNKGSITDDTGVAIILLKYDYVDEAISLFDKSANHGDGEALYYLGIIYGSNEKYKNIDKSIAYHLKAIDYNFYGFSSSTNPNESHDPYYFLASIYMYEDGYIDNDKAKYFLEKSLKNKNVNAIASLGHYYLNNSEFENAQDYFNQSIENDDLLGGYYGFLTLYAYFPEYKNHNSDKAFEYLNKILEYPSKTENDENLKYKAAAQFYMDDKKYYDLKKSEYYKKKAENYNVYN
jgi:tetratricopeptide (TPR) repeat protein